MIIHIKEFIYRCCTNIQQIKSTHSISHVFCWSTFRLFSYIYFVDIPLTTLVLQDLSRSAIFLCKSRFENSIETILCVQSFTMSWVYVMIPIYKAAHIHKHHWILLNSHITKRTKIRVNQIWNGKPQFQTRKKLETSNCTIEIGFG